MPRPEPIVCSCVTNALAKVIFLSLPESSSAISCCVLFRDFGSDNPILANPVFVADDAPNPGDVIAIKDCYSAIVSTTETISCIYLSILSNETPSGATAESPNLPLS